MADEEKKFSWDEEDRKTSAASAPAAGFTWDTAEPAPPPRTTQHLTQAEVDTANPKTQFEKERTPQGSALSRGVKAFGSDVLGAAQGVLQAVPGMKAIGALSHGDVQGATMSLIPGADVGEKINQLQEMRKADTSRKEAGYSPLYRGAAAVGQATGVVDPTGMEEAAKHADTAGVAGHTVLPLIGAAVGADQALTGGKGLGAIGKASGMALKKVGEPFHIGMSGEELLKKGVSPRAQATGWDEAIARPGVQRAIKESHEASPIKSAADMDEAIPQMKDKIWSEKVEPALERQAKRPVDMKPAAEAVRKQITPEVREFDEGHAKELDSLADKLEGSRDIEGANRLLKYVNGKLESYFSKYPSARRANLANNPDVAGWESARRAIRDQFLDTLEKAGESQVRDARQDYGGLETIGKEVERRVNVADRSKPWSLSRILGWSSAPVTGPIGPIMGEVATHLNKPDVMIKRGVGRLNPSAEPQFTPPAPFTPETPQRIGVGAVSGYKPSEKAGVMSAPRKSLGPEFEAAEQAHEIERNQRILRNPRATAEDKRIAQSRLDEMSEPSVSLMGAPSKQAAQRTARDRAARIREVRNQ